MWMTTLLTGNPLVQVVAGGAASHDVDAWAVHVSTSVRAPDAVRLS